MGRLSKKRTRLGNRHAANLMEWVSECYQSLTEHQHQNGHTVPKQVIMIATSIQVATVYALHCVRAFAIRPSLNKMSDKTWYPGCATGRLLSAPRKLDGSHRWCRECLLSGCHIINRLYIHLTTNGWALGAAQAVTISWSMIARGCPS